MTEQKPPQKRRRRTKKPSAHYVNNRDFTDAVIAYITEVNAAKAADKPQPPISNYIADCFMRIATGLSKRWNFAGYTYRDEMLMDGVENCLRYITRFDITRAEPKKLNAFAYFTQICYFAFVRRINKEAKQQEIKLKMQRNFTVEDYIDRANSDVDGSVYQQLEQQINTIKTKADDAFDKKK